MLTQVVFAGAIAGLASGAHCATMCGPLCAAVCRQGRQVAGREPLRDQPAYLKPLRYQLGRTLSYAFAGSIAGQLGALVEDAWLVASSPLLLSAGVAIALLVLAARLWRGGRAAAPLVQLGGAAGRPRPRSVFGKLLALVPREPTVFGALSVLLPCGALAAALLLGAATGDRLHGAALMAGFAITSGLGVVAGGALLARLTSIESRRLARGLAVALAAAAIAVCVPPLLGAASASDAQEQPPSCH